jgi:hypothetical protein
VESWRQIDRLICDSLVLKGPAGRLAEMRTSEPVEPDHRNALYVGVGRDCTILEIPAMPKALVIQLYAPATGFSSLACQWKVLQRYAQLSNQTLDRLVDPATTDSGRLSAP